MKHQVQFRFLQVTVSTVTGDRATVAVLHWDGLELRTACSLANVPSRLEGREAIERSVKHLLRRAKKVVDAPAVLSLGELFPVRSGIGASLAWTPVRTEVTADPRAHFDELVVLAKLVDEEPHRQAIVRRARKEILNLGRELEAENEGLVKTNVVVESHHQYKSPLSWKNGTWHHTMIWNLTRPEKEQAATQRLVGQIDLAIPGNERAVVVALIPNGDPMRTALDEVSMIRKLRESTRVLEANADVPDAGVKSLRALVEEDIRQHRRENTD